MNPYEEELQKRLEGGQNPEGRDMDMKAYRQVFSALEKDPGYRLPDHFAARVVTQVQSRRHLSESKDYLWFAAGIVFLAIASVATILFTGLRFDFGFLNAMSDYKGLAIFGIVFVIFLNWLDKRFVKAGHVQD